MENLDNIFIDGLEESCKIGTTPEERAFPQTVFISIRLFFPLFDAGNSDDLKKSVDYAAVAAEIRSLLSRRTFNLVETVAESIAKLTLQYPLVEKAWVRVEKKVLPGIRSAGAEVRRERKP